MWTSQRAHLHHQEFARRPTQRLPWRTRYYRCNGETNAVATNLQSACSVAEVGLGHPARPGRLVHRPARAHRSLLEVGWYHPTQPSVPASAMRLDRRLLQSAQVPHRLHAGRLAPEEPRARLDEHFNNRHWIQLVRGGQARGERVRAHLRHATRRRRLGNQGRARRGIAQGLRNQKNTPWDADRGNQTGWPAGEARTLNPRLLHLSRLQNCSARSYLRLGR